MQSKGCNETDILDLLDLFPQKIDQIEVAFNSVAQQDDQVEDRQSPSKASAKNVKNLTKSLPMINLQQFMSKVEDVVDTELETLHLFIKNNTHASDLEFNHFYDLVYKWGHDVWQLRIAQATEIEDQKNKIQPELINPPAEQSLQQIRQIKSKPKQVVKQLSVTIDKKDLANTVQLLELKFDQLGLQITEMLESYEQKGKINAIDTKKSFDSILIDLVQIIEIAFCYHSDEQRINKKQMDKSILKLLKDYFLIVYKDDHGYPQFFKEDFCAGIIKFFESQNLESKSVTNKDYAIALDTSVQQDNQKTTNSQEKIQEAEVKSLISSDIKKEDDKELVEMRNQIIKNKINYQNLLDSGKIKDEGRRQGFIKMIQVLEEQLQELDVEGRVNQQNSNEFTKDQYLQIISPKADSSKALSPVKRFRTLRTVQKKKLDPEEQREKSFQEMFQFYSRQHIQTNVEFEEFQEQMKKLDMGEFFVMCRDFQIILPRQKLNQIFKKAAVNSNELVIDTFKEGLKLVGKELSHAKLKENIERLKQVKKVIKDLNLPESYPNKQDTQDYDDMITKFLDEKTEKYMKYVDNKLRQLNVLSEQVPSLVRAKDKKAFITSPKNKKKQEEPVANEILKDDEKVDPFLIKMDQLHKFDFDEQEAPEKPLPGLISNIKQLSEKSLKISIKIDSPKISDSSLKQSQIEKGEQNQESNNKFSFQDDDVDVEKDDEVDIDKDDEVDSDKDDDKVDKDVDNKVDKDDDEITQLASIPNPIHKNQTKQVSQVDENLIGSIQDKLLDSNDKSKNLSQKTDLKKNIEISQQILKSRVIQHPIHLKVKELEKKVEQLEKVVNQELYMDYICDDVMELTSNKYRSKIKGFHLAFNVVGKVQQKNQYKFKYEGTAEEIRLKALTLKNQRIRNKELEEQQTKEKYDKDRKQLRIMHEKLRKQKQEQLNEIAKMMSPQIKSEKAEEETLAYLTDPRNYQAIIQKQDELKKARIDRVGKDAPPSKQEKDLQKKAQVLKLELKKQQVELEKEQKMQEEIQRVENIITKGGLTFDDIENLNYDQINQVSNKYGEDAFDPNDILDIQDNDSQISESDEILKRFISTKPKNINIQNSQISDLSQDGDVGKKRFSKPSNQSYRESIQNTRDTKKMRNIISLNNESGSAKVGLPPMYSPLQQHNPKRKKAAGLKKHHGSIGLTNQQTDDYSSNSITNRRNKSVIPNSLVKSVVDPQNILNQYDYYPHGRNVSQSIDNQIINYNSINLKQPSYQNNQQAMNQATPNFKLQKGITNNQITINRKMRESDQLQDNQLQMNTGNYQQLSPKNEQQFYNSNVPVQANHNLFRRNGSYDNFADHFVNIYPENIQRTKQNQPDYQQSGEIQMNQFNNDSFGTNTNSPQNSNVNIQGYNQQKSSPSSAFQNNLQMKKQLMSPSSQQINSKSISISHQDNIMRAQQVEQLQNKQKKNQQDQMTDRMMIIDQNMQKGMKAVKR